MDKRLFIILYEKQNGKCPYCGCSLLEEAKNGIAPHLDHIKPKSKGGKNEKENYCLACNWCNRVKKDKPVNEFIEYIQPYLHGFV